MVGGDGKGIWSRFSAPTKKALTASVSHLCKLETVRNPVVVLAGAVSESKCVFYTVQ